MAKVNVNEFVIQMEHISDETQDANNNTTGETLSPQTSAPTRQSNSIDIDAVIDLCVERVFQLLKEHKNR